MILKGVAAVKQLANACKAAKNRNKERIAMSEIGNPSLAFR
jgi:hypothetical protein